MPQPLDAVLAGIELEIAGRIWEGAFYECRNGTVVGPMVDDGCQPMNSASIMPIGSGSDSGYFTLTCHSSRGRPSVQ